MEAGYTETGNDTEKTTEHFTSSYEGNNVLLMLQGSPFSFDSVCGSPFPSLWVSSCCDSDRRVSRPPDLVSNASAGSRLRGSRSAKEYQRTQATALNESWVFLCAFLSVSTFRGLREVWRRRLSKLVGRLFDDCRGDSIGGCWRGGFLFFRGAGALLGACTNARLGFIRGMFIGNEGSRGFLQEVQTPLAIKDCYLLECERESEVTQPSIGIRALHLPFQVHTQSSEHTHTHTLRTHTRSSGQPFMLRRPGSNWGFCALLKSTS